MDHETAVRISAAERYHLGEMTGADRDAFEEHYFMCPECAEDVRALTVFAANAKTIFREESANPSVPAGVLRSASAFRLSAGLNAVLFGVLCILLVRTPREQPKFVEQVTVLGPARGPGNSSPVSHVTGHVILSFYQTKVFDRIGYELKDGSGASRLSGLLPAPPMHASGLAHLSLPVGGISSGEYEVRIWGVDEKGNSEIGRSRFHVGASAP
ncbi:MAG TPA: zf-HC2 domain-containing protein [Bryobacteraceae bacterium]|jgi:putative zinc finger protein|nr:zf-HC2 domain-containing protein [Bryobacteraceae bacterium]